MRKPVETLIYWKRKRVSVQIGADTLLVISSRQVVGRGKRNGRGWKKEKVGKRQPGGRKALD